MTERSIRRDLSLAAVVAGFVAVLVGFTSSVAIVVAAAQAVGATPAQTGSWRWALGLGMGVTSIGLSWWYRQPVLIAWSTPGAALIAGTQGIAWAEAVGAFVACGLLIVPDGVTRVFDERVMNRMPQPCWRACCRPASWWRPCRDGWTPHKSAVAGPASLGSIGGGLATAL